MAFPPTHASLIRRLAAGGHEVDWDEFHRDYWGPIGRFARWFGGLSESDAEDVASEVFQTILKTDLLARWVDSRTAKLRTLLCTVARNILSNRWRVDSGRARIVQEHGGALDRYRVEEAATGDAWIDDAFYSAWAAELLHTSLDRLLADYRNAGREVCFRVLHSRICDRQTIAEAAAALKLPPATVDNYYRHARERLSNKLRETLQQHVSRYSDSDDSVSEFEDEWGKLGVYLTEHGGLEDAVRQLMNHPEQALRRSTGELPADETAL